MTSTEWDARPQTLLRDGLSWAHDGVRVTFADAHVPTNLGSTVRARTVHVTRPHAPPARYHVPDRVRTLGDLRAHVHEHAHPARGQSYKQTAVDDLRAVLRVLDHALEPWRVAELIRTGALGPVVDRAARERARELDVLEQDRQATQGGGIA